MIRYTPLLGTFEFDDVDDPEAWFNGGPFARFMRARGFEPVDAADPFVWSSDYNGGQGWRRVLPKLGFSPRGDHRDWIAGGKAVRWRQCRFPYVDRGIIAYSHAGQLVAEACADGLDVPWLVTVATPVRGDMLARWTLARRHIGCWIHLRASVLDPVMLVGTLGDGLFSASQDMPDAINLGVRTMRHGRLLNDPTFFETWEEQGWLDVIRRHVAGIERSSA